MKTILKITILSLLISLTGCNKDDDPAPTPVPPDAVIGTWKLTKAVFEDGPKDLNFDGNDNLNVFLEDDNGCIEDLILTFKEDKTTTGELFVIDTYLIENNAFESQNCYDYDLVGWSKNETGDYTLNLSELGDIDFNIENNKFSFVAESVIFLNNEILEALSVKYTFTKQ